MKVNPITKIVSKTAPYVPMDAVDTDNPHVNYLEERNVDENSNLFKFQTNDVLFARITPSTENGKTALMENFSRKGIASSELTVLRPTEKVEPRYLYYYVKSHRIRQFAISQMMGTTNRQRVPDYVFKKDLNFELPPIDKQQKIVSILSNVDNLIVQYDSIIESTKCLKSAIIQETLNKISKNQIESKFGDFLEIQSGEYFTYREFSENGIPVLKIDNVMHGKVSWETKTYLPKTYLESHKHLVLNEGDIVLALNRPITHNKLKISMLTKNDCPSILYQRVGRFIFLDPGLDKEFFFSFSNTNNFKKLIFRILVGSDQPYVKTTELLRQKIQLPEISEQRKLAKFFSNFNSYIEELESKKSSLKSIKKGLMQKLLTGQIRV